MPAGLVRQTVATGMVLFTLNFSAKYRVGVGNTGRVGLGGGV
jgi:hypothetical protein